MSDNYDDYDSVGAYKADQGVLDLSDVRRDEFFGAAAEALGQLCRGEFEPAPWETPEQCVELGARDLIRSILGGVSLQRICTVRRQLIKESQ